MFFWGSYMRFLIEEIELSTFHIVTSPNVAGKSIFWTFYVLAILPILTLGPRHKNSRGCLTVLYYLVVLDNGLRQFLLKSTLSVSLLSPLFCLVVF